MKLRLTLATLMIALVPMISLAQDRADQVRYLDRTKNPPVPATRNGTVTAENPAKLTILTGLTNKQPLDIRAADIIEVRYDGEPEDVQTARSAETKKDFEKALAAYRDAARKAPAGNKFMQAHLQFRLAKVLVAQADSGSTDARAAAIEELRKFKDKYPDSRQIVECLDTLSRLLVVDGKSSQEVVDAFRQLRTKYAENKDIANRCDLFETQLLLQDGQILLEEKPNEAKKKYTEAQAKLQGMLQGADKNDALDIRIALSECKAVLGNPAEALKDMDSILKEAGDDHKRAAAYLGRADCYRLNKQLREAMWDYLWVDVVYNQDREQQAKALFHLRKVFEGLNDSGRAQEVTERLKSDQFRDTRFQKLAGK